MHLHSLKAFFGYVSKCLLTQATAAGYGRSCFMLSKRSMVSVTQMNASTCIRELHDYTQHLKSIITSSQYDQVSQFLKSCVRNKHSLSSEEWGLILYSCARVGDVTLTETVFRQLRTANNGASSQACRLLLECYASTGNFQLLWNRFEQLVKERQPLDRHVFHLVHHSILVFQRGDKQKMELLQQLVSSEWFEEYETFSSSVSYRAGNSLISKSFGDDTFQLKQIFSRLVQKQTVDLFTLRVATISFLRCGYSLALDITRYIHDTYLNEFLKQKENMFEWTVHDRIFLMNDIVSRLCIRASLPPRLEALALLAMRIVERLEDTQFPLNETTKLHYLSLKRFQFASQLHWKEEWKQFLAKQAIPFTASKQSYHGMLKALLIPPKPSAYLLGESGCLWKEMQECGWQPNLDSFFLILSHFALNRELNAALQCYKYMCDRRIRPTTYILYQLLEACTKPRSLSNRLTFLRDHQNIFLRKDIVPWYIREIVQKRETSSAIRNNGETTDVGTFSGSLGLTASLEQNANIALKLATEWSRWQLPVKTVAFVKLAYILADAGKQECMDVLRQMSSHGMELREYFLASLLKRYLYNGSFNRRVGFRELYQFIQERYPQTHHPWMIDALLLYHVDNFEMNQILPLVIRSVKDNKVWPTTSGMSAILKAISYYANDNIKVQEHVRWFIRAAEQNKNTPRQLPHVVYTLKERRLMNVANSLEMVGRKYPYRRQFNFHENERNITID
eukprot:jgi/Galph1/5715/GphlegSOOS_G4329.1